MATKTAAKKTTNKAANSQVAKIAALKNLGPVQLDPKKIAHDALHGKANGKPAAKAAAPAPAPKKKAEPKFNANAVDILRDVQKGSLKLYGFPAKGSSNPFWLYAYKVAGQHGDDEQRVMFTKIKELVTVTKKDEESGMLLYGLTSQGKQAIQAN